MAKQVMITAEGLKQLEEELQYLKGQKRKEVAEKIKVARSYGDLSENSEYDDAKNEQAILEARIVTIEATLKNAVLIDEEDPSEGKISDESPVGAALIGHSVGDAVEVEVPVGVIGFKVLEIFK